MAWPLRLESSRFLKRHKQPCWHNKRTPPRNSEIEKATSARYNFEALKVAQIILDSTSTCGTKSG